MPHLLALKHSYRPRYDSTSKAHSMAESLQHRMQHGDSMLRLSKHITYKVSSLFCSCSFQPKLDEQV